MKFAKVLAFLTACSSALAISNDDTDPTPHYRLCVRNFRNINETAYLGIRGGTVGVFGTLNIWDDPELDSVSIHDALEFSIAPVDVPDRQIPSQEVQYYKMNPYPPGDVEHAITVVRYANSEHNAAHHILDIENPEAIVEEEGTEVYWRSWDLKPQWIDENGQMGISRVNDMFGYFVLWPGDRIDRWELKWIPGDLPNDPVPAFKVHVYYEVVEVAEV